MIATLTIGKRRAGSPSESGSMRRVCALSGLRASARSPTRCVNVAEALLLDAEATSYACLAFRRRFDDPAEFPHCLRVLSDSAAAPVVEGSERNPTQEVIDGLDCRTRP